MADRTRLIDALCEAPQFASFRDRRAFIRATFERYAYGADLDKALQWLNWEGNVRTVAGELARHIDGRELAPGVLAADVLLEAIAPRRQAPAVMPSGSGFDVFLCHNSRDKAEVKKVAEMLKARGLRPWLDEWQLQPGIPWQPEIEKQFASIKSAAVFLGEAGLGQWQEEERQALLSRSKGEKRPVIPVFLWSAPVDAKFSPFLGNRTHVDFRKRDPDALEQLIFGITGEHPRRASAAAPAP